MRRLGIDRVERVERGEILTPSLTKRLTLTRSLASRLKGTETGKAGLGAVRGLPKACAFGTGQILVKHSLTIDAGGRWARQNFLAFTFHEK